MNTKRILLAIASICAMAICSSSCKKDDKPNEESAVTASIKIDPAISDDFKSTCSINYSCTITDQNGTSKSNGVLVLAKEITGIVCPCTITLDYTYAYLNGKDVDASKSYSLEYGPVYTIRTSKSTMQIIGDVMSTSVKGSGLSDWISLMNTVSHKEVYSIDKNGKITSAE